MSDDIRNNSHWGWRIVNGQATFMLTTGSFSPTLEDLTRVFYIKVVGKRQPDGKPRVKIAVARRPFNNDNPTTRMVVDDMAGQYRFYVDIQGLDLNAPEVDILIQVISDKLRKKGQ